VESLENIDESRLSNSLYVLGREVKSDNLDLHSKEHTQTLYICLSQLQKEVIVWENLM
jgi:hypothetical protein